MGAWFDHLATALDGGGAKTVRLSAAETTSAGSLLICPIGGRVIACELPGVEGNLFWHNPKLTEPGGAAAALASAGGDLGGDRLWLAPEVAYMWPSLEAARADPVANYDLPPAMDPGAWRVVAASPSGIELSHEAALTDHRSGRRATVRVDRRVHVAEGPDAIAFDGVTSLSFGIENRLTMLEADEGAVVGAWELLQLPPTGELICPTWRPGVSPRSYYNPFGDRHVFSRDDRVVFRIDGRHRIKMGLAPSETTGRMAYQRTAGDVLTLIVRCFLPQPGEPYVDLPRDHDVVYGGDALQAYNDDGGAGGFGEMEHHDPALVSGREPASRTGVCLTHVLAGPEDRVKAAGRSLLGVAL